MNTFRPGLARCAIAVLLIGAAVLVCYENSVKGAFVFDDNHFIVENDNIKHLRLERPGDLKRDIENIVAYNPFRALLSISFALNFKYAEKESFNDFSPYGFHVTNMVIHFLVCVLAFFVVRKIIAIARRDEGGSWAASYFPALTAALLFAVCPLHTEAVTYIVQRGESMCAMFMLAAMLCFLYARSFLMRRGEERRMDDEDEDAKPERKSYAWALAGIPLLAVIYKALVVLSPAPAPVVTGILAAAYFLLIVLGVTVFFGRILWRVDLLLAAAYFFFGLAALTKEMAVVLPLLLLLTEAAVFRAGRTGHVRRSLRYHAPFLITLALFFVLRILALHPVRETAVAAQWEGTDINAAYLAQQVSGSVVLKYLGMTFIPMHLNLDPDMGFFGEHPADRLISTEFIGLVLVILGTLLLQKYSRLAAFGVLWFFVALLPTSSVVEFSDVMAEHRVYLASLGIFMAVGVALVEAARLRKSQTTRIVTLTIVTVLLAGVLVSNTVRVRRRNEQYREPVVLWTDTVLNSPDKARPYNALGYEYMKAGSPERIIYLSNRTGRVIEKLRSMSDVPETDAAVQYRKQILQKNLKRLDARLQAQTRNLVLAKMYFKTAEIYDQKGLWQIIRSEQGPSAAPGRFKRLEANRIYNNLGVVYSQESEGLKVAGRFAEHLARDKNALEKDLMLARLQALACYQLSLMLNPFGVQPLVNSSKIRCSIAADYKRKAMAAIGTERDKYWGFVEKELDASEFLVLKAMMINRNFMGAVNHMNHLETAMALYYDPHYAGEGYEKSKDAGKALEHWRRLQWLSNIDPTIDEVAVQRAIDRLEMNLPDE